MTVRPDTLARAAIEAQTAIDNGWADDNAPIPSGGDLADQFMARLKGDSRRRRRDPNRHASRIRCHVCRDSGSVYDRAAGVYQTCECSEDRAS